MSDILGSDQTSSPEKIAWTAGLFEGEGTVYYHHRDHGNRARTRFRIKLTMTDRDVVERFASIMGTGTIIKVTKMQPHHKDAWCWQTSARAEVLRLCKMLIPYMGKRRGLDMKFAIMHLESQERVRLSINEANRNGR